MRDATLLDIIGLKNSIVGGQKYILGYFREVDTHSAINNADLILEKWWEIVAGKWVSNFLIFVMYGFWVMQRFYTHIFFELYHYR